MTLTGRITRDGVKEVILKGGLLCRLGLLWLGFSLLQPTE